MKKIITLLSSVVVIIVLLIWSSIYGIIFKTDRIKISSDDGADIDYISNVEYIHLSFDDVSYPFGNLSTEKYTNLFEEPFFGKLKKLNK